MAALPWFRLYHETATDPKVQMLSEADQRRYIMLLCLRCCNGDVTLQDNEVAFQLRITEDQYAETKAVLIERDLIDETNSPRAWDKRQINSDSSAARVAAHRARNKQAGNVTGNSKVTKTNAVDTDTDTDTEEDPTTATKIDFGKRLTEKYGYDEIRIKTVDNHIRQFAQWNEDVVTLSEFDSAVKHSIKVRDRQGKTGLPSIHYLAGTISGRREDANVKPIPAGQKKPPPRDFDNTDYRAGAEGFKTADDYDESGKEIAQ